TLYLLGAMAAAGLASEAGGGAFELSEAGSPLARSHPDSVAQIVLKEWFFYGVWAGLPQAIRDGHAGIPPWRERLGSDQAQSLTFLRALDDLAARFGDELPGLAGLESGGTLLDAGGGAGSHAACLAEAVRGLEPTVLDLPEAEQVLRERHPELGFLAGDLDEPRFGRPEGERWDHVLLANILHDHPPEACERLVREAAALLAPGGTLLVYEWVIDESHTGPPPVATFALMMLLENEGGRTHDEQAIAGWMRDAGLESVEHRRGGGPISVLRGTRPA
ncbi:MAG: methyltransferase domain-containing protein, partial [Actinobacteria bacterium]|nr:methyltransferase domain-containing protein [Actinomycetota bacterium]